MISGTQSSPIKTIGHDELRRALLSSADHLEANSHLLDRLNVFPVPDGDTGSNMVATFHAGIKVISDVTTQSIGDISRRMIPALLTHSRGNSGFILARFFAGFFEIAGSYDILHVAQLGEGFANGSYHVTTSLFSPVEGTAITIIAAMARSLAVPNKNGLAESLRRAIETAREALHRTPEMLPVLARAGVVDSGALGFIVLMEGFLAGITKEPLEREREDRYRFAPRAGETPSSEENLTFRYCTELVLSDFSGPTRVELHDYLTERGDSIALVAESGMLKLHIHTNEPEELIGHLSKMGRVESKKVEDMQQQVHLATEGSTGNEPCEVLAVVPGPGFSDLFGDLGIDHTLVYDETLPSAGEIGAALARVSAGNVVLLPNNRNILPAAMIAREDSEKNVSILPTETVVQGLTAVYGYSENCSADENLEAMRECVDLAESFALYRAAESTRFHKTDISRGDFFIARGDEILAAGPDPIKTTFEALAKTTIPLEERGNISLFTGAPESGKEDAELLEMEEALKGAYPDIEVERYDGGQHRAIVIISVE